MCYIYIFSNKKDCIQGISVCFKFQIYEQLHEILKYCYSQTSTCLMWITFSMNYFQLYIMYWVWITQTTFFKWTKKVFSWVFTYKMFDCIILSQWFWNTIKNKYTNEIELLDVVYILHVNILLILEKLIWEIHFFIWCLGLISYV